MSMIMSLASLDRDLTESFVANPDASFELTIDPAKDAKMAAIGYPINRVLGGVPAEKLSLEKGWHILHFALTKTAWGGEWPRNFLTSGQEMGGDIGYGPGKLISAAKVAEAASQLSDIDIGAELKQISDDDVVDAEIYSFSHGGPLEVWRDLTETAFKDLIAFLQRAQKSEYSVFISIG